MTYQIPTRDDHFQAPGPKRILALDGGGLRGIATLRYLARIEDLLRTRHDGDPRLRLAHYFDLIAGTSTGAIIAAALALGMSVEELTGIYMRLGSEVFRKSAWRKGIVRARYSEERLTEHLREIFGADTTLGSPSLRTGLLVVTKRMDTGSPWPLGNNPRGRYFDHEGDADGWIPNKDFPLWKVVRASTAAPMFFDPERITISEAEGLDPVIGSFVDGGVSPFNNPTLQAFMYATLGGFRVGWETGADRLLIVSVGTGRGDAGKKPTWFTAVGAMQSLLSLMDDAGALVETMAQWLSSGPTHREIDGEIGALTEDVLGGAPSFSYARYDLGLDRASVDALMEGVSDDVLASLTEMDIPDNMPLLYDLADLDATRKISEDHFPRLFDLPNAPETIASESSDTGLSEYRRREDTPVTAVRIDLDMEPFSYRKWGGVQTASPGDWLVSRDGDSYTVDGATFERSYREVGPGGFVKVTSVWARAATSDGSIATQEGETNYRTGDMLVFNDPEERDGWAMGREEFDRLYVSA
jgi:predicted acylesterase/phospholipase RssA